MTPEYGIKLAVHLISTDFGDHAAKVCDCLLRKGTLALDDIVRTTKLSPQQVKTYLKVLIQHNCVQAFAMEHEGGCGEGPVVVTQYMLLFDNILHRMRFPKLLAIVSEELDKECEELFEAFLKHGWLTLQQILDRVPSNQNEGNCTVQDALRGSFTKLVNAHYVERCPAPDPFLVPPDEEKTPARKHDANSAKAVEELEIGEQCDIAKATPSKAKGFPVITDTCSDINGDKSIDNPPGVVIGKKRKQDALKLDTESGAASEKDVPWRANYKELVCHLRHKACIENVRARLDSGAAIVLSAMLEATQSAEKNVKEEISVLLSINTITEAVMQSEAGCSMTLERIRASLVQLGCHPNGVGADETYDIDLKKIIELAQNDEVESMVLKRYGREAHRIFRLLSKSCCPLETTKISDTTFIEKKEAAKILHKLWKDECLHMEKIVLNESRQSQFMLWKVKKDTFWRHILDEMYHAALNLSIRIIELRRDKHVGALRERDVRLAILLQASLMKLDDALMLFHDF
ncbi:DNA-directed RNA polymerase III subunit RPC3-like isoform X1 [Vitis riparia]|uniref:DNA-directed RNA polymerase III subunit RPC3-like isoform X1 n=1 Tax=Vitis riparia TaxID=96939 RepID=UPI00155B1B5E|nr:DNA-directed RNA polymerase III subunit RPC3-like isoform X1 [Vitis riparia]XP_034686934.1 DNA-directed RNA polymerase III subunit RPC3-like isoform X1 [Vitis riparia]XP_034686935.1 DNA-directed RNA polymerase III subunit RPC3-like isoform X1 [Vitis riparia]XP_034686936.1 DNA-directed RNA polymerase III subunit RPC3-like isoform X1 [Vitis riparia]